MFHTSPSERNKSQQALPDVAGRMLWSLALGFLFLFAATTVVGYVLTQRIDEVRVAIAALDASAAQRLREEEAKALRNAADVAKLHDGLKGQQALLITHQQENHKQLATVFAALDGIREQSGGKNDEKRTGGQVNDKSLRKITDVLTMLQETVQAQQAELAKLREEIEETRKTVTQRLPLPKGAK